MNFKKENNISIKTVNFSLSNDDENTTDELTDEQMQVIYGGGFVERVREDGIKQVEAIEYFVENAENGKLPS